MEYAFANSQRSSHSLKEMAQGAEALQNADFQDLFETPSEEEIEQAKADLAELGLSFESDNEVAEDVRFSRAMKHHPLPLLSLLHRIWHASLWASSCNYAVKKSTWHFLLCLVSITCIIEYTLLV